MILEEPLRTERLILRTLDPARDASETYLGWFSDPEITRFLEVRLSAPQTTADLESFIDECNASPENLLLGMTLAPDGRHIGNIKLGPINSFHRRAELGLMIGDKSQWGKGYATEAIAAISEHAFAKLGLAKLVAGVYSRNIGSYQAFIKAGYVEEGRLSGYWDTGSERQDEVLLGKRAPLSERRFGDVTHMTLIGGGTLMMVAAHAAKRAGFSVSIVLAPRHAEESLDDSGRPAHQVLAEAGFPTHVVEDINAIEAPPGSGPNSVAMCIGPAWIFQDRVRESFGAGMINFNNIPIPHYLGGAHFTWQVLNGNREGGCILQEIDGNIDRGAILRRELYSLPETVRVPADYFSHNAEMSRSFLLRAFVDMRAGTEFARVPFSAFESGRLYFPRLMTRENAWIDWSWGAKDIEAFCRAFDAPYPGAATLLEGNEVRLSGVSLAEEHPHIHPYCAGLIVRKSGGTGNIYIAAAGGILRVTSVSNQSRRLEGAAIKEGRRFATPPDLLHRSKVFRPNVTAKHVG
jgi:RimJ/RimL family protein N-acetyltransferase/methionyl-tRNA formyltransferase